MTIKVKLLEPIEGYSDIAEWRIPLNGETAIREDGVAAKHWGYSYASLVLTPIPKWRPATLEDAIRAIKGETVEARFKDKDSTVWQESELVGYDRVDKYPFRSITTCYEECEVLDV